MAMTEPGCRGAQCPDGSCTTCRAVPEHVWAVWKRKRDAKRGALTLVPKPARYPDEDVNPLGYKLGSKPTFSRIEGLGGSSPALAVVCPVCVAAVGVYCQKPNGDVQIIAHKKRREMVQKESI